MPVQSEMWTCKTPTVLFSCVIFCGEGKGRCGGGGGGRIRFGIFCYYCFFVFPDTYAALEYPASLFYCVSFQRGAL